MFYPAEVLDRNGTKVFSKISEIKDGYLCTLYDSDFNALAFEEFSVIKSDIYSKKRASIIYGDYIKVIEEKNLGKGYGEILRGIFIINMIKNRINYAKLYSLTKAIPFHNKMGFSFSREGMQQFITKMKSGKNINCPNIDFANKNEVEKIYKRLSKEIKYLKEEGELIEVDFSHDMILSRRTLTRKKMRNGKQVNKELIDYYNNLFSKYGIDFKI